MPRICRDRRPRRSVKILGLDVPKSFPFSGQCNKIGVSNPDFVLDRPGGRSLHNGCNFHLSALDYNNGDGIQYTYDEKGRLIQQVYEDGVAVTYQYDNDGALASVTDSSSGITTRYFYDYTGRATKYTETGEDFSHTVAYTYNSDNNLSQLVETVNGTTYTTSYTYDKDNRITAKTTNGITEEYTYDALGRLTQQVTKNGETTVKTETYTYNGNSSQVTTYRSHLIGGYTLTNTYSYDDNGNILSVSDGTNTTSYVYDSQNQLIRENNQVSNYTRTWTYDNAGNILKRQQYAYATGEITGAGTATNYSYGDERSWQDLLTSYDGKTITYDEIGNPLTKGSTYYAWEHGRQLAAINIGGRTGTYSYNADGLRTARTFANASYRYIYSGDQLVQMEDRSGSMNVALNFTYDAQGIPVSFTANGVQFYYLTNLQGDVVAITNASGGVVARYTYDAWGTCAVASNNAMGQINPLRYRGYVYDVETELYYLQNRYYDPYMGRFINADEMVSTGQGLTGNNTFTYCGNNPITRQDSEGTFWKALKTAVKKAVKSVTSKALGVVGCAIAGAVCGAAAELVSQTINYVATGEPVNWGRVVTKGASGAVYGATYSLTGSDTCAQATANATETIIDGVVNGDSLATVLGNTVHQVASGVIDSTLSRRVINNVSNRRAKSVLRWFAGDYYKGKYVKPNPIAEIHRALVMDACGEKSRGFVAAAFNSLIRRAH